MLEKKLLGAWECRIAVRWLAGQASTKVGKPLPHRLGARAPTTPLVSVARGARQGTTLCVVEQAAKFRNGLGCVGGERGKAPGLPQASWAQALGGDGVA